MSYEKEISRIVAKLVSGYKPDLVILFGSLAKRSHGEDSDIDLLIVKETNKRPIWRRVEVRKIIDTDIPLDVIVYTPYEFDLLRKNKSAFIEEVLEEGSGLYGAICFHAQK